MKERIKKYMDYKSVSAGELSSLLEVQRSNISHILNGRNKPGASFIEKLLIAFPDLNARWLLTGDGAMTESEGIPVKEIFKETIIEEPVPEQPVVASEERKVVREDPKPDSEGKGVEKVVVLYTDGTFKDFDRK